MLRELRLSVCQALCSVLEDEGGLAHPAQWGSEIRVQPVSHTRSCTYTHALLYTHAEMYVNEVAQWPLKLFIPTESKQWF